SVVAARNFDRLDVDRPEFKVSRAVIERALETGEPVVIRDAGSDAALAERASVQEGNLRSIAAIPIGSPRPSGVSGLLYLDNRFEHATFEGADRRVLATFAANAAVAVENARLAARAERRRLELEAACARAEALAKRLERELETTGDELARVRARV